MSFENKDELDGNNLIFQYKSIEKLSEKMQFLLLVLYSLDGQKQELFMEEIRKIEKIFVDIDFMRDVKLRDSLVENYTTEYFGKDYGWDDPFKYMQELEKKIVEIDLELLGILGRVIMVTKNENIVVGDEA